MDTYQEILAIEKKLDNVQERDWQSGSNREMKRSGHS